MPTSPPRVLADLPLSPVIEEMLQGRVELLPLESAREAAPGRIDAIYTYGHPLIDAALLDRLPDLRVVSNFGVGVDHIDVAAAAACGVLVGNTPGVLDGATADMAFALLLAAGRRLAEGDRYARGPDFLHYDPSYIVGREIHGSTLGVIGMGRIGEQVVRRARGFDMTVLYHNRRRRPAVEEALGVRHVSRDELLAAADYVVLTVPLTPETHRLIGRAELNRMKPTAILVNVSRGAVVDADALTEALASRRIYAAALDVTDPEPLPRDHPLLRLDNVIITPHLGSAPEQTRRRMAKMSVENLMAGLAGRPLPFPVIPPGAAGATREVDMDLELRGQTAVIVGGARGIGRAVAEAFAAEGANVALLDRDPAVADAARELAGRVRAVPFTVDVTDFEALKRAAAEIQAVIGRTDHVVHAAAVASGEYGFPFWNLEPADWGRMLQVNVVGAVNVAHAFAPALVAARSGTMLFLASVAGQIGSQTDPPYSASKAALINFAQCAAKDLAPYGVRVNALCPGMVETVLSRSVWEAWNRQQPEAGRQTYEEWAGEKVRRVVPLGRWQRPEDVAAMAVFLASARAANVTGQTVNVDGGYVMR